MPEPFTPDPKILKALGALAPKPWAGTVWRHTFAGYPPEQRNVRGARWNPTDVQALYTSVEEATALAEAEHLIELQPLRPRVRRTLYELDVELDAVLELTDRSLLSSLGVSDPELESDDYGACQAIGGAAAFLRFDGIIVPSARAPGANLVILFASASSDPAIRIRSSREISD